jgi:hypothetical protein
MCGYGLKKCSEHIHLTILLNFHWNNKENIKLEKKACQCFKVGSNATDFQKHGENFAKDTVIKMELWGKWEKWACERNVFLLRGTDSEKNPIVSLKCQGIEGKSDL